MAKLWLLIPALLLIGCTTRTHETKVIKEYIKVPAPCDIPTPPKPEPVEDVVEDVKNMMVYTTQLEQALSCCQGSKDCVSNLTH